MLDDLARQTGMSTDVACSVLAVVANGMWLIDVTRVHVTERMCYGYTCTVSITHRGSRNFQNIIKFHNNHDMYNA